MRSEKQLIAPPKSDVHLSVVIPVYGCPGALFELVSRLDSALPVITEKYEIILVNDASPDNSWDIILRLAANNSRVRGLNLSRNFGQHRAITAGLDNSRGSWVVVMDGDLQDLPEEIPNFYKTAQSGFDIVVGLRTERQDTWTKITLSKTFHWVFSYLTDGRSDPRAANFGLYSRKVIDDVNKLREQHRSFPLFARWVGYRHTQIPITHAARVNGRSSYTFSKSLRLATDIIVSYSDKLLILTVKAGLAISVSSLLITFCLVVRYFLWTTPIAGWTSLIVAISLSTGLILGALGILGLYIGRILEEVKQRPLYLVANTTFDTFP